MNDQPATRATPQALRESPCSVTYPLFKHMSDTYQLTLVETELQEIINKADEIRAANCISDTQRMDWLERNLLHLSHGRATNSVDMGGVDVRGQLINEARGSAAGPSYFQVKHRSIREAIDDAMQPPNSINQRQK